MRLNRVLRYMLLRGLALACLAGPVWADTPVARAVLFYSPTCGHCHQVITEDLPPLFEKYGEQLQVVGVDVTQPGGQALYQAAIQRFGIPQDRLGVPTLIVGEVVLVGSLEIPQQLPGLIETHLAQGGVDWPDIPGLSEALAAAQPSPSPTAVPLTPTATAAVTTTPTVARPTSAVATTSAAAAVPSSPPSTPTVSVSGLIVGAEPPSDLRTRLARDPLGNSLAIAVLIGVIFSVGWATAAFRRADATPPSSGQQWAIPLLSVIGLGVAGYLAYVETAQVTAVCGPVGDCNAVQQSEYARLFGVIPIGVLGVAGYVMILAAWSVGRYGRGRWVNLAGQALFVMTFAGTLFSVYLTFLEPFVIGATCAWCLASAVIMTLLMLLNVGPAVQTISAKGMASASR